MNALLLAVVAIPVLLSAAWAKRTKGRLSTPSNTATSYSLQRYGGKVPEPQIAAERTRSFVGAVLAKKGKPATIITERTTEGLEVRVVIDSPNPVPQITALAQAVAAKHTTDPSVTPIVAHKHLARWQIVGFSGFGERESLDAQATTRAIERSLEESGGGWVGLSVGSISSGSLRRLRTWIDASYREVGAGGHMNNHYSRQKGSPLATMWVSADDANVANDALRQAAESLPRFDLAIEAHQVTNRRAGTLSTVVAATGLTLIGVSTFLRPLPALAVQGAVAAIALGIWMGILNATGLLVTEARRAEWSMAAGVLPAPAKRRLALATAAITALRRRAAKRNAGSNDDGQHVGTYPLDPGTALIDSSVISRIASPHSEASAVAVTRTREIPVDLRQPNGAMLGTDEYRSYIADKSRHDGVAILGKAGAGKSVLSRLIFAADLTRRNRRLANGQPGMAVIALETKGEGVGGYADWCNRTGTPYYILDLTNPATPAIDLLLPTGTIAERASAFAALMADSFSDGSIMYASLDTLRALLAGALSITPDFIARNELDLPADRSYVWYANMLLGREDGGDEQAVLVANRLILDAATEPAVRNLLNPLYGLDAKGNRVTAAVRSKAFEAPRSKISLLVQAEPWFSPMRSQLTWDQILEQNAVVIINTGSTYTPLVDPNVATTLLPTTTSEVVAAMLLGTLRQAIMRTCAGWDAIDRRVSIYCDELSVLVGSGPEAILWLRNQGRSYGVWTTWSAQTRSQFTGPLDPVWVMLRGYGVFAAMASNDLTEAATIAREVLDPTATAWTSADLELLGNYRAVIKAGNSAGVKQQPFVVAVPYYESDHDSTRFETALDGR